MAEPDPLRRAHDAAVDRLAAELLDEGATPAAVRREDESHAWVVSCVELEALGVPHITIAVDHDFPFAWPRVYLPDASKHLRWPHVEHDGRLCLHDASEEPPCGVQEGVGRNEVLRAKELIRACSAGDNHDDFVSEFDSYWPTRDSAREVLILHEPSVARPISAALVAGRTIIVGDDDAVLRPWARAFWGAVPKHTKWGRAVIAKLRAPLRPPYPSSLQELLHLLAFQSDVGDAAAKLVTTATTALPVVLVFEGQSEMIAGACVVDLSKAARRHLHQGFRAHSVNAATLRARAKRAPAVVHRLCVQRVDPAWLHSRGGAFEVHDRVREKIVTIVGCGSVGAPIANALAQAGVGGLHLIDPDTLSWNNVARHPLGGASYLHANKAEALRSQIAQRFPHIDVRAHADFWQHVYRRQPEALEECDLVVSTTGSWACDAALSVLSRTRLRPPLLFGWSEAHGVAGHALLVKPVGGCLHCGVTVGDRFALEATEWPQGAKWREPACGAFYSPMGASDLMPVVSMVAGLALEELSGHLERSVHRTWLGPARRLDELGGRWGTAWQRAYGDAGVGERVETAPWRIAAHCRLCTKSPVSRAA